MDRAEYWQQRAELAEEALSGVTSELINTQRALKDQIKETESIAAAATAALFATAMADEFDSKEDPESDNRLPIAYSRYGEKVYGREFGEYEQAGHRVPIYDVTEVKHDELYYCSGRCGVPHRK